MTRLDQFRILLAVLSWRVVEQQLGGEDLVLRAVRAVRVGGVATAGLAAVAREGLELDSSASDTRWRPSSSAVSQTGSLCGPPPPPAAAALVRSPLAS